MHGDYGYVFLYHRRIQIKTISLEEAFEHGKDSLACITVGLKIFKFI